MDIVNQNLAPIVLFAFKRPYELSQTIKYLQNNYLAKKSEIYIYVDGPKLNSDIKKVEETKNIVRSVTGFKNIYRHYSSTNMGLAKSVINGVTEVINKHGSVIVVEDDLLTSPNFLNFMNQCLLTYKHTKGIFSITGYSFPFSKPPYYTNDIYVYPRTGSWGWATWADRWQTADWSVSDYDHFIQDYEQKMHFNQGGSDRVNMLKRWKKGQIDSWAIRWCYAQAKVNGLTIYPTRSKVQNIGFSIDSTNTDVYNRYKTTLDTGQQTIFNLPESPVISDYYLKQLQRQYSLVIRILNRIRTHAIKLKMAMRYG